jgi:uncharacterized membrane protein
MRPSRGAVLGFLLIIFSVDLSRFSADVKDTSHRKVNGVIPPGVAPIFVF